MLRTSFRWVAIVGVVLGAGRSATAQAPSGNVPSSNVQVGFEQRAQLSPQDQLAQSDIDLAWMDQAASTVRHMLEAARAVRDVVKILYLNDKLSQLDVCVRSARDRQSSLQAALKRHDTELANHEFSVIRVLRRRAEQLLAEANEVVGEEVAFVGQTQVVTTVDENLPGGEIAEFPPSEPVIITVPPVSVSSTM